MHPEILTKDEYEMQYYGFSTTQFMENLKEKVKQIVQEILIKLEEFLISKGYDKKILKEGIDNLYLMYLESTNIALGNSEEQIRNIFDIPDNVLLEEDLINDCPVTNDELWELNNDVAQLEKQIIQEKLFLMKCYQLKTYFDEFIEPVYKNLTSTIKSFKKSEPNKCLDVIKQKLLILEINSEDETSFLYSSVIEKDNFFD